MNNVIKNLKIYPTNIKNNLKKLNGLHFSQNVMLKLIEKGLSREKAYLIVQQNAMKTWNSLGTKNEVSFFSNLNRDKMVKKLITKGDLKLVFDNKSYLKNISHVYKKLFKK